MSDATETAAPTDQDLAHIVGDLRSLARPITELVKDPANLRLHTDASIDGVRSSLAAFRQRKPVVVQVKPDGTKIVRAGNGTLEATVRAGKDWIAAVYVKEDDITATAYAIADNRTAELSSWDLPNLRTTLGALDLDVPGVDDAFMDYLEDMAPLEGADGEPEESSYDPEQRGADPEEQLDGWADSAVRQIVMIYPNDEYEEVLRLLAEIQQREEVESNTDALTWLLRHYAELNDLGCDLPDPVQEGLSE